MIRYNNFMHFDFDLSHEMISFIYCKIIFIVENLFTVSRSRKPDYNKGLILQDLVTCNLVNRKREGGGD